MGKAKALRLRSVIRPYCRQSGDCLTDDFFFKLFILENWHFTTVFKQKFPQLARICSPSQKTYSRSPEGDVTLQL